MNNKIVLFLSFSILMLQICFLPFITTAKAKSSLCLASVKCWYWDSDEDDFYDGVKAEIHAQDINLPYKATEEVHIHACLTAPNDNLFYTDHIYSTWTIYGGPYDDYAYVEEATRKRISWSKNNSK